MAKDELEQNIVTKNLRRALKAAGAGATGLTAAASVGAGVGTGIAAASGAALVGGAAAGAATGGLALAVPVIGYGLYKGGKALANYRLSELSDEQLAKLKEEYRNRIGFGANVNFSSSAFEDYIKNKPADFNSLAAAKLPDGSLLKDKLTKNTSAEAKLIKKEIAAVLKPSEDLVKAQKEFENAAKSFKELVTKEVPKTLTVEKVLTTYYSYKAEAIKAIGTEHDKEIAALKQKFTEEPFKKAIEKEFDTNDLKAIEDSMIADLKKSQKEKLDAFEKSTNETFKQIQNSAAKEMNTAVFVGNLKRIGVMKNKIAEQEAIAKEERLKARGEQKAGLIAEGYEGEISVIGDPAKLGDLTGKSGKTIIYDPNTKTFNLKFRSYARDPLYYTSPFKNINTDLLLMTEALMASSDDPENAVIKMTIKAPMPPATKETIAERSKQVYEACLKAGFKPENITLVVNRKELKNNVTAEDRKNKGADDIAEIKDEIYPGLTPEQFAKINKEGYRAAARLKPTHIYKEESEFKKAAADSNNFKDVKEKLSAITKDREKQPAKPASVTPSSANPAPVTPNSANPTRSS